MKEDLGLFGNELNLFTTYFKCVPTLLSSHRSD